MRVIAQPAPKPQPQRRLSVGSTGPAVLKLEQELKERGLLKGAIDSNFDKATRQAVKRFERSNGWKANGIVGGRIWKKLELSGEAHEGTTANVTRGKTKFSTVNINVKSNPPMSQDKVLHDVKRAAAAGDIIGWNEISTVKGPNGDRYFDAIKSLGKDWGHYMPKHGNYRIPNPISWKKKEWDLVDSGFRRTHKNGASAGHTNVSPARYVTWVKLKNKKTGDTIIRMNTHLISGAWNSKNNKAKEWRKDMGRPHAQDGQHGLEVRALGAAGHHRRRLQPRQLQAVRQPREVRQRPPRRHARREHARLRDAHPEQRPQAHRRHHSARLRV